MTGLMTLAANCNTALGSNTLGGLTSGSLNVVVGANAGSLLITGQRNVVIGASGQASTSSVCNEVSIYNGCTTNGTARFQGTAGAWSFSSDVRKKEQITPLALGIDFVNELQPRHFVWKETKEESAGFIAQEVDTVVVNNQADYMRLVNKNDEESWMLAQTNLIPVLVKAIQELSSKVNELEAKLAGNG
jgi:hypothetical protein